MQVEKLHKQTDPQSQTIPSFLIIEQKTETHPATHRQESLLKSLSQFEKVYISRSFSRLSDSVNQLFAAPSRSLPREDELSSVVKLLARYTCNSYLFYISITVCFSVYLSVCLSVCLSVYLSLFLLLLLLFSLPFLSPLTQ